MLFVTLTFPVLKIIVLLPFATALVVYMGVFAVTFQEVIVEESMVLFPLNVLVPLLANRSVLLLRRLKKLPASDENLPVDIVRVTLLRVRLPPFSMIMLSCLATWLFKQFWLSLT